MKQIPEQGKVSGVAFSEDRNRVYTGNGAGRVQWFRCDGYKLSILDEAPESRQCQLPPGKKLVYVAHGDTISALDAQSG